MRMMLWGRATKRTRIWGPVNDEYDPPGGAGNELSVVGRRNEQMRRAQQGKGMSIQGRAAGKRRCEHVIE